ncbi:tripartite ATP-independent transporter solute receptor, DctP family [Salinibacillus kushneri]|uniref:Tripartite ATP-independent transporter solute receptor, DctP family n=1 Tax=Salinibacillus kushneri TaxID=237682 RepID=A0A1H9YYM5_9BACI|nr:TRAP transporter substrate-binding protein [Salinibacillus kushneri]SES74246.1 tripartite ATP-independent transporter solute receptor, DctP family [Salinibacillus kushneri]
MKGRLIKGCFFSGVILVLLLLGACSQQAASGGQVSADQTTTLTLAHIHNDASPVYQSLEEFAKKVEEKTSRSVKVKIFAEGVLGGETKVLELVQNGVIDMTKVNGGVMEKFDKQFSVFSLPYVFQGNEHFHQFMKTDTVQKMYRGLEEAQLRGITYYDAGARSFYTANTKIKTPDDLKGLKIRVMNNVTSIETMELLGASPTPMSATEVYTSLQQGIIDGAESSPIALVDANHGEVAKQFSFDEHTRIPDFLIMSDSSWDKLSESEQQAVLEAGRETTKDHNKRWTKMIEDGIKQAKEELNVEFTHPEQTPFRKKVKPLIEERRQNNPEVDKVLEAIEALE